MPDEFVLLLLLIVGLPLVAFVWLVSRVRRVERELEAARERIGDLERVRRERTPGREAEAGPADVDGAAAGAGAEPKPRPGPRPEPSEAPRPERRVAAQKPAAVPPPIPEEALRGEAMGGLPRPPGPRLPRRWKALLRKLNLLPPRGETAEAALAAWWLTRVGLVVLIIAAVFFGVRVAAEVPPWVRVATLAAVAAGVLVLGGWLEKRVEGFGRLVSAGGLALGFFTAFAAYGIPATKVIASPAAGVAVQALAVAATLAWAFWKRDERVASMGLLLGYVACWFSAAHDLDDHAVAGLVLLAAGGGAALVARGWLWAAGTATAGSWFGFFLLAVGEWPPPGTVPSLWVMLGAPVLLAVVLEVANELAEGRARRGVGSTLRPVPAARVRRWLAVANASAAIGVTWLAVRLAFPGTAEERELDAMFLVLAVTFGGFAASRQWGWRRAGRASGLAEAYFLKASGLLALLVVEVFDGPARWLSLAAQALVVLVAWRRAGRGHWWLEAGYAVLFGWALAVVGYDATAAGGWSAPGGTAAGMGFGALSVGTLVAVATLTLLSATLALHARWGEGEGEDEEDEEEGEDEGQVATRGGPVAAVQAGAAAAAAWLRDPAVLFRLAGAIWIGLTAIAVATGERVAGGPAESPVVTITLVALAVVAPAVVWRRAAPVLAGLVALGGALLVYSKDPASGGTLTGLWMVLLGFSGAEAARRLWRSGWVLGDGARMVLHVFGLTALAVVLDRCEGLDGSGWWRAPLGIGAAAVAAGLALVRQHTPAPALRGRAPGTTAEAKVFEWFVAAAAGLATFVTGCRLGHGDFGPVWMAAGAALVFAAARFTRNAAPALAGGLLLTAAVHNQVTDDFRDAVMVVQPHRLPALLIAAICFGIAVAVWKGSRSAGGRAKMLVTAFSAVLHSFGLIVLHDLFGDHLEPAAALAADAMLALAAVALSHRWPLPALVPASAVPLLLGSAQVAVSDGTRTNWAIYACGWLAGAAVLAWFYVAGRRPGRRIAGASAERWGSWSLAAVGATALAAGGFSAAPEPWAMAVAAGFAVAFAALGRWRSEPAAGWMSFVPLGLAATTAVAALEASAADPGSPARSALAATCLVAAAVLAQGVVLLGRGAAGEPPRRRPAALAWLHGLGAIALVFPAFASGSIGTPSVATVWWGATAVAVTVTGFATGLRPYRLAGLVGIALAIARMFLVDIVDPLYRIYAFFGVAVVLLGLGYLYHRFRDRIGG